MDTRIRRAAKATFNEYRSSFIQKCELNAYLPSAVAEKWRTKLFYCTARKCKLTFIVTLIFFAGTSLEWYCYLYLALQTKNIFARLIFILFFICYQSILIFFLTHKKNWMQNSLKSVASPMAIHHESKKGLDTEHSLNIPFVWKKNLPKRTFSLSLLNCHVFNSFDCKISLLMLKWWKKVFSWV